MRNRRLLRCALAGAVLLTLLPALARALPPAPADQPPNLRACCALGYNLAPRIGSIEFPIRIGNVSAERPFGKHSYAGALRIEERNSHVYTCRGGFIDLAHVRDNADWTAFLIPRVRALVGSGKTLELPDEAGQRRVRFPERDVGADLDQLSESLARRITLDLSVWHEIASWYGFSLVPIFPERLSAFSPEDFYSNVIGTELGVRAYRSKKPYDDAMEDEIIAATQALDPVPSSATKRAFQMIDGLWWDSRRFVPDNDLVTRRYLNVGPVVMPWRVPGGDRELCSGKNVPAQPQVTPDLAPDGEPLSSFYRFEVDIDPKTIHDEPFTPLGVERVTERDFDWIIAVVRKQMRNELGPEFEDPDAPAQRHSPSAAAVAGDVTSTPAPAPSAGSVASEKEGPASAASPPRAGCGPSDPICRIQMEGRVAGFHLLDLKVTLGASVSTESTLSESRLAGGGEIRVFDADIPGGDIRALMFDIDDDRGRRDLVARFTVAESDAVWFCEDQESGELHPPIAAWFRPCKNEGIWGLGGSVGEFQYDGATGRSAIRAFEFDAVANAFGNANSRDYLTRRLLPYLGLSLDSVWPGNTPAGRAEIRPRTDVSPRAVLGIRGLTRTPSMRWELQGYAGYRQDVSEARDLTFEGGMRLYRHFPLGLADGSAGVFDPDPSQPSHAEPHGWGLLSLGLETGFSYWAKPENQIQGWVGPFVSDRNPRSWQALLTFRYRPGEMTF